MLIPICHRSCLCPPPCRQATRSRLHDAVQTRLAFPRATQQFSTNPTMNTTTHHSPIPRPPPSAPSLISHLSCLMSHVSCLIITAHNPLPSLPQNLPTSLTFHERYIPKEEKRERETLQLTLDPPGSKQRREDRRGAGIQPRKPGEEDRRSAREFRGRRAREGRRGRGG